jgi:ectoine hydroxylase-related dioxygenase (phytanoyl-CoA dioxygenase family)
MTENELQFEPLVTDGYMVIRQFLSSEEIREYTNFYAIVKSQTLGDVTFQKNRPEALLGLPYFSLHKKIDALVDCINEYTNFDLNYRRPSAAFFDTSITSLMWHQDDDTEQYHGKLYRSVNFWIPIIKPDPIKSGLCLVSPLKLKEINQSAYDGVIGRGDIGFIEEPNKTTVINRHTHEIVCTFDFEIEPLAETPVLHAGDLLLFRGDVPHRTQDHDTNRVAIGVRCSNVKS